MSRRRWRLCTDDGGWGWRAGAGARLNGCSLLTFLCEGGGFCSKGVVDALLHGANRVGLNWGGRLGLGLEVSGGGSCTVEATGVESGSEVDGATGAGDLTGHKGFSMLVVVEELVHKAVTNIVQELLVRRAYGGVGGRLDQGEVVGLGLARAAATGGSAGDERHGITDEAAELLLPEPGEGVEEHGLGDGLQPLQARWSCKKMIIRE